MDVILVMRTRTELKNDHKDRRGMKGYEVEIETSGRQMERNGGHKGILPREERMCRQYLQRKGIVFAERMLTVPQRRVSLKVRAVEVFYLFLVIRTRTESMKDHENKRGMKCCKEEIFTNHGQMEWNWEYNRRPTHESFMPRGEKTYAKGLEFNKTKCPDKATMMDL